MLTILRAIRLGCHTATSTTSQALCVALHTILTLRMPLDCLHGVSLSSTTAPLARASLISKTRLHH